MYFCPTFDPTFRDPPKPTFGPTFDLLEFLGFSGPLGGQGQHKVCLVSQSVLRFTKYAQNNFAKRQHRGHGCAFTCWQGECKFCLHTDSSTELTQRLSNSSALWASHLALLPVAAIYVFGSLGYPHLSNGDGAYASRPTRPNKTHDRTFWH